MRIIPKHAGPMAAGGGRDYRRRGVRRSTGQAMVEFALILPLLVFMMVVIIDFGRALFVQTALQNGAREGARFGTIHPTWVTSDHTNGKPDPDNIVYRARTEPAGTVSSPNPTVTCTTPGGVKSDPSTNVPGGAYRLCAVSGSRIEVQVTARFDLLTPILSNLIGSPLTLSGATVMTIE